MLVFHDRVPFHNLLPKIHFQRHKFLPYYDNGSCNKNPAQNQMQMRNFLALDLLVVSLDLNIGIALPVLKFSLRSGRRLLLFVPCSIHTYVRNSLLRLQLHSWYSSNEPEHFHERSISLTDWLNTMH